MSGSVTCCGIELRREERRTLRPRALQVIYSGDRGGLSIRFDAEVNAETGALESACWHGFAMVTLSWTGPSGPATDRETIARAAGSTAQGCADTLAEMVRSVAAALAGVSG